MFDIPCPYVLRPRVVKAIAYKSNILFLPESSLKARAVLFKTETNEFAQVQGADKVLGQRKNLITLLIIE